MKSCLILFLLVWSCASSMFSQDLLVTQRKDSINCDVGVLDEKGFYPFIFMMDGKRMEGLIHKDSVLLVRKKLFRSLYSNRLRPWYPLLEIGIDAGVAHQLGAFRQDPDLTSGSGFQARTGYYIGADITYFVSKRIGYGVKYNYRSLLGGDLSYNYLGPLVHIRFWSPKRKNNLFFMASVGYGWMEQKDAPVQVGLTRPRITMSAKAVSGDISVGGNLLLSKAVSLRVKLSGIVGFPSFKRVKDIQKYVQASDEPLELGSYCDNMNSINLSVGFTFHK